VRQGKTNVKQAVGLQMGCFSFVLRRVVRVGLSFQEWFKKGGIEVLKELGSVGLTGRHGLLVTFAVNRVAIVQTEDSG
jgi:hypothetical protein